MAGGGQGMGQGGGMMQPQGMGGRLPLNGGGGPPSLPQNGFGNLIQRNPFQGGGSQLGQRPGMQGGGMPGMPGGNPGYGGELHGPQFGGPGQPQFPGMGGGGLLGPQGVGGQPDQPYSNYGAPQGGQQIDPQMLQRIMQSQAGQQPMMQPQNMASIGYSPR